MPQTETLKAYCYCEYEGQVVDRYTVRTEKNKDRQLLTKNANNIGKYIVEFVSSCLVAIDDKETTNQEKKELFVKNMEKGDIFNAFYRIKTLNKNDLISIDVMCDKCGETFNTEYDYKMIDKTENKEIEITIDLPNGYKDKNGVIHKDIVLNKATGQTIINMGTIKDPIEAVWRGIASRLVRLGELEAVNYYILMDLDGIDASHVEKTWLESHGGIQTKVEINCHVCGYDIKTELSPAQDFFV